MVVDHDSGPLVWAAAGNDEATLHRFFDELGPQRAAAITHITADMAPWIAHVVAARAPDAVRCADPLHVVAWATDALDIERRRAWNAAAGRRRADPRTGRHAIAAGDARTIKRARYALWKNPARLTPRQRGQLDWIAKTDPRLWRAYLLEEGLCYVFPSKATTASKPSTTGSGGPDAADSRPSSNSNARSSPTEPPSRPR